MTEKSKLRIAIEELTDRESSVNNIYAWDDIFITALYSEKSSMQELLKLIFSLFKKEFSIDRNSDCYIYIVDSFYNYIDKIDLKELDLESTGLSAHEIIMLIEDRK